MLVSTGGLDQRDVSPCKNLSSQFPAFLAILLGAILRPLFLYETGSSDNDAMRDYRGEQEYCDKFGWIQQKKMLIR